MRRKAMERKEAERAVRKVIGNAIAMGQKLPENAFKDSVAKMLEESEEIETKESSGGLNA